MGWRTLNTALVVLLVLLPVTGVAEVTRAVVSVDGMSCPFCAFGVEKKLNTVDGTSEVTVDMKGGTATLVAKDGKSLEIGQIGQAVRTAGFTPGRLRITAIGVVKQENENLLLVVRNSSLTIYLLNLPLPLKQQLLALVKSGAVASLSGTVHEHVDDLPAMTTETVLEVTP